MEVKDIIKKRREELGMTYEQLGNIVGVGKSTVRKWETGLIENMRRDNIVALSKALNISPAIIMGWQPIEDNNKLLLSKDELILISNYNKLDTEDKNRVVDYTDLLSNQDKYKILNNATDEVTPTEKEATKVVELPKQHDEFTKVLEARKKAEQYFKENPHLMPVACHDDNLTDEENAIVNEKINEILNNLDKY
nr:MAG TPA: helix-turn-helix domain protein [Caudoviricetes sp.]